MRSVLQAIHQWLLRGLGLLALLYAAATLAAVPTGLANGHFIAVPIVIAALGTLFGFTFLRTARAPGWLSRPATAKRALACIVVVILSQIFLFAPMANLAVIGFETPEPQIAKYTAGLLLPPMVLALLLALSAALLGYVPGAGEGDAGAQTAKRPV